MPLDTAGYRDFGIGLGSADVETPQALEVRLDPSLNNGADTLAFYSGVLKFGAKGKSADSWLRGSLAARVPTAGRKWSSASIYRGAGWTVFRGGTVVLSLASIYNAGQANYAGWAVDAAQVEASVSTLTPQPDDHLQIEALIAVRDSDGILYRVSYHICAIGQKET